MIVSRSLLPKIATATLVAAGSLFVAALAQALDAGPDKGDLVKNPSPKTSGETSRGLDPKVRAEMVAVAADRDPFQPGRVRGPAYQLPGEAVGEAPAAPPNSPKVQVYGTVVTSDCGSALVLPQGAKNPRFVTCGDRVQGFRVAAIGDQSVTFTGADDTPFEVALTPANMRGKQSGGQNDKPNAPRPAGAFFVGRGMTRAILGGGMGGGPVIMREVAVPTAIEHVEVIKGEPEPDIKVVRKYRRQD